LEFEHWPRSSRKPSVSVLFMLAELYETDVLCLLDLADHVSLPQQDRLMLLRRPRAATPFGERLLMLMEARGWSLRETARRVPCDASYLSKIVHGRKGVSGQMAARLDDLLEAGGELAALAETAEAMTGDGEPTSGGNPPVPAGDTHVAVAGGMSLSLPFVPGRAGDRGIRPGRRNRAGHRRRRW
jgi:transcriptional regulator with XRE-family HTH domain